jgi:hypothetical protein
MLRQQMDENTLILNWLSSLSSAQWSEFDAFRWNTEFCGDVRQAALAVMLTEAQDATADAEAALTCTAGQ